jgi:hypothetical protein
LLSYLAPQREFGRAIRLNSINEIGPDKVHLDPCYNTDQKPGEVTMKKLRVWAMISLTLGIAGLICLFFSFLALTDISHGEENAHLEWAILRLAFFVIFFLIIAIFICTGLVLKYFRDKDAERERKTPD